ncbi:hypothetical protein F4804DRAFT_144520 [Jackrogersella minutella]|nr:hypothetical protein F4804DRAFT_144520 [Jackrogersella minutella]
MQPSQTPSTPGSKVPLNGLFRNGVWHCNCIPRLPAVQFQVKKDNANKGRTFYTCQKDRDKKNKCDFFLWAEDAYSREVGSVLTNTRSEGEDTPTRRPKRQRTLHESITPSKEKRSGKTPVTGIAKLGQLLGWSKHGKHGKHGESTPSSATAQSSTVRGSLSSTREPVSEVDEASSSWNEESEDELAQIPDASSQRSPTQSTLAAGSKRKRPEVEEEYSDFSSGEEGELVALVDESAKVQNKHRDAYATPSFDRSLVAEAGLPTPLTEKPVRRVLFADPEVSSAKRARTDNYNVSTLTPTSTSTPHQPSSSPSSTPSSSQDKAGAPSVTQEVMALLDGQKIDDKVLRGVRGALDRHAAKAKGLERGRDASRDAIRKAEARVAALQGRVADLENQKKLDSEARQKMRTDLMKLYRDS